MRFHAVPLAIFARVTASSTSPAVGSHVAFVSTRADGVPRAGVTRVGEVALTSPPVPVEVAPQRVSTIAQTVVSSRTVAAAAVIVVLSGTVRVFIPDSEETSESINAQALVTFVASVTSAPSSTFIIVRTSLAVRASISLHPHAIRHTIVLFGICTILGEPVPDCCTSIECEGV